jgi:hypothetical protein
LQIVMAHPETGRQGEGGMENVLPLP